MTLADEILGCADGPIEGIVVGRHRDGTSDGWHGDEDDSLPDEVADTLVAWEVAEPYLRYEYDEGFGGQDCHSFYAWTAHRVIFVGEYDGATGVEWLPRHPTACAPRPV